MVVGSSSWCPLLASDILFYMMSIIAFLGVALASGLFWRRPAWRRQLLAGGALYLPLFALSVAMAGGFWKFGVSTGDAVVTVIGIFFAGVSLSALMAVGYERTVNRWLTPNLHVSRRQLWWLGLGPIVALGMVLGGLAFIPAAMVGLFVNAVVLVWVGRFHLLWDAVISAVGVSAWYGLLWFILAPEASGDVGRFALGGDALGVTLWSRPIEFGVAAMLSGALVGPLFSAAKPWRWWQKRPTKSATTAKIAIGTTAIVMLALWFGAVTERYVLAPVVIDVQPSTAATAIQTTMKIRLQFSRPINRDSLTMTIDPDVAGSWHFSIPQDRLHGYHAATYVFDTTLEPGTTYVATISGIQSVWGTATNNERITFTTRATPEVTEVQYPAGASTLDPCAAITIPFASIDDPSAQYDAKFEPAMPYTIERSVTNEGLIIRPQGCFTGAATTLTIYRTSVIRDSVTAEIIAESERMAIYETRVLFTIQPVTVAPVLGVSTVTAAAYTAVGSRTILPIKLDYQDQALSCEAAALKMALAGVGVFVSEKQIMAKVGYDPTPHKGSVWGDPDRGFVGNIAGRQNTTGYGVHWKPIARAASAWRTARTITNFSAAKVAAEIKAGHPVIVWGLMGNARRTPWQTADGRVVSAWKGEHARTVIGFYGPVEAPTHFVLNDPIAGRLVWTKQAFLTNSSAFGRSGVVVE